MAQKLRGDADDQWQEPMDCDALWGPFARLRPDKSQPFTSLRALVLAAVFGGFYGLALNLIGALCTGAVKRLPSVYAMPLLLGAICFLGVNSLLAPAWNRRAHFLKRRQDYLAQAEGQR